MACVTHRLGGGREEGRQRHRRNEKVKEGSRSDNKTHPTAKNKPELSHRLSMRSEHLHELCDGICQVVGEVGIDK